MFYFLKMFATKCGFRESTLESDLFPFLFVSVLFDSRTCLVILSVCIFTIFIRTKVNHRWLRELFFPEKIFAVSYEFLSFR